MSDDTRVAIVAGAAGELGRATAATLTDRGFLVVGSTAARADSSNCP
jgi:NAD(P)-dependent dehydrogenase (short-subunit alcohol dehydrogenase family)